MPWKWIEEEWPKAMTILASILGGMWGAGWKVSKWREEMQNQNKRLVTLEQEHHERSQACPAGQIAEVKAHLLAARQDVSSVKEDQAYLMGMVEAMHSQILKPKRLQKRRNLK